jgi:hypothetical protein
LNSLFEGILLLAGMVQLDLEIFDGACVVEQRSPLNLQVDGQPLDLLPLLRNQPLLYVHSLLRLLLDLAKILIKFFS